jgi:hypothetical protein
MTAQELEQEIERTREHLGDTIDELAGKADLAGPAPPPGPPGHAPPAPR